MVQGLKVGEGGPSQGQPALKKRRVRDGGKARVSPASGITWGHWDVSFGKS